MNAIVLAILIAAPPVFPTTATVTVVAQGTIEIASCTFTSTEMGTDSCKFDHEGSEYKAELTYKEVDAGLEICADLMRKDGEDITRVGRPCMTLAPGSEGEGIQGAGDLSIKMKATAGHDGAPRDDQ